MKVQISYTALCEYNAIKSSQFKANITRKRHHVIETIQWNMVWSKKPKPYAALLLQDKTNAALINFTLMTLSIPAVIGIFAERIHHNYKKK